LCGEHKMSAPRGQDELIPTRPPQLLAVEALAVANLRKAEWIPSKNFLRIEIR
jgi:hypothetical protein